MRWAAQTEQLDVTTPRAVAECAVDYFVTYAQGANCPLKPCLRRQSQEIAEVLLFLPTSLKRRFSHPYGPTSFLIASFVVPASLTDLLTSL